MDTAGFSHWPGDTALTGRAAEWDQPPGAEHQTRPPKCSRQRETAHSGCEASSLRQVAVVGRGWHEQGPEGGADLGTPEFSISQTTKKKTLGWESHTVIGSNRDLCTNIKYHLLLSRFHKRKDSCHQKMQRRAFRDQDVPLEWTSFLSHSCQQPYFPYHLRTGCGRMT